MHDGGCRSGKGTLIFLVLLLTPNHADAADPYAQHYQQAEVAYQSGRYEESLRELKAAYAVRPWPQLLFNMGKACQKLGRIQEALDYFDRYLHADLDITPETRAKVGAIQAELRAQLPSRAPAREALPATPNPVPLSEPRAERTPVIAPSAHLESRPWGQAPAGERPAWRIGAGVALAVAGAVVAGFGISGLWQDGRCVPPSCLTVYDTARTGGGLLGGGAVLVGVGVGLAAWPARSPKQEARIADMREKP